MRIVVDCAHGASYKVGPGVLEELGATVIPIGCEPDGTNINEGCGAVHPQSMRVEVIRHRADLGIAFDGDADRVIFSDEQGNEIDGDQIMALCAVEALKDGVLKKNTLVTTVMSNLGLDLAMKKHGIEVVRTAVGDRYVVEEMRRGGFCIGGEQSGHMVFLDHNTTGDGLVSALQVLAIVAKSGKKISKLASVMNKLPQVMKNVAIRERQPLEGMKNVQDAIRKSEEKLREKGRVLVRYSGTELLCRVMIEGEDESTILGMASEIAAAIQAEIGVQ
jgi:phosphoglucosamine mutase